jgi:HAD superfamily hydrolase (TIGR01509 family)
VRPFLVSVIETIFFDMDGTLVDTELAAAKAVQDCFATWNHSVTKQDADFVTGRTWEKALEFLFSKYPPPMDRAKATVQLLDAYRATIETELVEVEGARACVLDLAKEFPLALVSGSHRREILSILGRLGIRDCFKVVLGAEDYPASKPAPDGYNKALAMLGGKPETTLVFEDSVAGINSGLAAGLQVCVITSTNHFGHNTNHGHYFVADLKDVNRAWVKALSAPAISG